MVRTLNLTVFSTSNGGITTETMRRMRSMINPCLLLRFQVRTFPYISCLLKTLSFEDMNDPEILEIYGSLVVLASSESEKQLEFTDCDPSRQSALQALAQKLGLQYLCDITTHTVEIKKSPNSSCQNEPRTSLGEDLNERVASVPAIPSKGSQGPNIDEIKSPTAIGTCWKCDILEEKVIAN